MILADKIIALRKKNGWSQEELAEKVNVSRQSVSKWEGAQSVPDLEKILQLANIFGVSTDYLLKDELEETEYVAAVDTDMNVRHVSMEEANEFLRVKEVTSTRIAFATFLCILSPITLILMGIASEVGAVHITENAAGGVGMIVLLVLVAAAVAIFISSGSMTSQFEYLEKEVFETEYGVTGMVKERQKQYKDTYTKCNVSGGMPVYSCCDSSVCRCYFRKRNVCWCDVGGYACADWNRCGFLYHRRNQMGKHAEAFAGG